MKKTIIIGTLLTLLLLSQIPVKNLGMNKPAPSLYITGEEITPPTNKVKFVYFLGGAPIYSIEDLNIFINDVLAPFDVEPITDLTTYEPLENATVLMLLGQRNFHFFDLNVLIQFLHDGGSLLIALPDENFTAFNDILELFSLKPIAPLLDNKSHYEEIENVIINSSYCKPDHPIIKSIFGNVSTLLIPKGIGLEKLNQTPLINTTLVDYTLVWGTNTTFADKNNNGKLDRDEPVGQNLSVIHIIELWYGGKIVILPSVHMIADAYLSLTQFDNIVFIKSLAYWLGNQIAYISIRKIDVKPTFINIYKDPLQINVSFIVTNEKNETINDVKTYVFLVRLRRILVNVSAENVDDTCQYHATLNVSGIKAGIAYVYILAYKEYYGYRWAGQIQVTLFKPPVRITGPDVVLLTFGMIVPLVALVGLIIYAYPEYRKRKSEMKEIEEKIKK